MGAEKGKKNLMPTSGINRKVQNETFCGSSYLSNGTFIMSSPYN